MNCRSLAYTSGDREDTINRINRYNATDDSNSTHKLYKTKLKMVVWCVVFIFTPNNILNMMCLVLELKRAINSDLIMMRMMMMMMTQLHQLVSILGNENETMTMTLRFVENTYHEYHGRKFRTK